MKGVRVSEHFGIVIRKHALQKHNVSFQVLLQVMETEQPLDEDEELISLGPHFGGEAANEFVRRLESLGLVYGDDFFDFADIIPDWCQLYVVVKK